MLLLRQALRGANGPAVHVLVLPGGTDSSYRPFYPWQGSALRMYPFTWSIRLRFPRRVTVRQVRYRVYGWNGGQASPMPYARAALDAVVRDDPDARIVVIGHSMGGRIAAQLAADPRVSGVLALAPWWQFADWRMIHRDARVVAIHGEADTVTFAKRTVKGIAELTSAGMDATYIPVPGGHHPMLDHLTLWQGAALDFVATELRRLGDQRARLSSPTAASENAT